MSEDATRIGIYNVYERGWLAQIFQPVCEELMAKKGPPPLAKDLLGEDAKQSHLAMLQNIISDSRYPPATPQEIVEIIREGDILESEMYINATVELALDLKSIVSKHLTALTGTEYSIY